MNTENKKILQETSRWLRVGFLTVTVLGPVMNTLSSLLRERAVALRNEAAKRGTIAYTQSQERLAPVGASLAESLSELKEHSYSQELLKRGTQISKEVSKRSEKVAKEVRKRTVRAQRQLAKRAERLSRQNTREITPFWAISSFSIGLIAAGIATYLLVRKRLQQQEHFSQNGYLNGTAPSTTSSIAYSNSRSMFTTPAHEASSVRARVEPIVEPLAVEPALEEYEAETEKMPAISLSDMVKEPPTVEETPVLQAETLEQQEQMPVPQTETRNQQGVNNPLMATSVLEQPVAPTEEVDASEPVATQSASTDAEATEQHKPAASITDAAFLGVVGTRHYYPIETPLNQLQAAEGGAVDVVYFATEDEAKAQGYTALL